MRQQKIMRLKDEETEIMSKVNPKDIKEVKNEKDITKTYDKNYKVFVNESEIVLDTAGTNLIEILAHDDIDETRTTSNDVLEIFAIFGIEACREALIYEINAVLKDEGVNIRHINLLVDTMTRVGSTILSCDRHSINRSDIGVLAKASFEESSEMLLKASVFSEVDNMKGVSANVIAGQLCSAGTAEPIIYMDQDELATIDEFDDEPETADHNTDICTLEGLSFDIDMSFGNSKVNKKHTDIEVNIEK
jgi:DNA-directed RNA polymerase II subunit RPB1